MADDPITTTIRILCRRKLIVTPKTQQQPGIQWLIDSPFLPEFTIVSTIRCIHTLPSDPDFTKEADGMRALLPRGFEVIGALIVGATHLNAEACARDAIDASSRMRKALSQPENHCLVGAVVDPNSGEICFVVSNSLVESVTSVVYEDQPEKYVWERGCILNCELPIKVPVYYSVKNPKDAEDMLTLATESVAAKLRDSKTTYIY